MEVSVPWTVAASTTVVLGISLVAAFLLAPSSGRSPSSSPNGNEAAGTSSAKRSRTGRCPFTAETDFIVETAPQTPPTPLDLYQDWQSQTESVPADTAATTSTAGTDPHYKPLAARWLNAGISGQDTPGVLRAGLKRLPDQTWFLVEDPARHRFVHELGLKRRHFDEQQQGTRKEPAFVQESESIAAQAEVLELFCHYLPKRYPDYYEYSSPSDSDDPKSGPSITVKPLQKTFLLKDYKDKPLELCARIVQEDLILIRPPRPTDSSTAYHMAAAAVVFSFQGLTEKLGRSIEFIHAPVPGFERQLRKTLELFFGKMLKVTQPLWRNNWVVTPESGGQIDNPNYGTEAADATRKLQDPTQSDGTNTSRPTAEELQRMFLKVEYQTIRRLPRSGYLLFTVKMMVDRLQELEKVPHAAACLVKSIRGMSPAMRAYKGIGDGEDATYQAIVEYLDVIAVAPSTETDPDASKNL